MKKDTTKGRLTAGTVAYEHGLKNEQCDVREAREEALKDVRNKLDATIEKALKKYQGNFYLAIEAKRELLLPNVVRTFIFHRLSCPTPHYDQTAFKYNRSCDEIEFLWSIPRKTTCQRIKMFPLEEMALHKELVNTVFDFYNGLFYRKALELNGEYNYRQNERFNDSYLNDQLIKEIYG